MGPGKKGEIIQHTSSLTSCFGCPTGPPTAAFTYLCNETSKGSVGVYGVCMIDISLRLLSCCTC